MFWITKTAEILMRHVEIQFQIFFENAVEYIGSDKNDEILAIAKKIQATGVKVADSCHVACAEYSDCDYFLTTDDRVLKYKSDKTTIINPVQFIQILSERGLK